MRSTRSCRKCCSSLRRSETPTCKACALIQRQKKEITTKFRAILTHRECVCVCVCVTIPVFKLPSTPRRENNSLLLKYKFRTLKIHRALGVGTSRIIPDIAIRIKLYPSRSIQLPPKADKLNFPNCIAQD